MKKRWIVIAVVGVLGLGVFAGFRRSNLVTWVRTFGYVLEIVHGSYVQDLDPSELIQNSIRGMLEKLDPYSVYLDTTGFKELKIHTTGEYGGLGFRVSKIKGEVALTIAEMFEGNPAYRAGIQAGDRIVKIDGESTEATNLHEAVMKMRGKPGTDVILTIRKEGIEDPIDFHLTRETIKVKSVIYSGLIESDIGYLRIAQFSASTGKEVGSALDSLMALGAGKFIIDLRGNPGGLLKEAIRVTDHFFPKGRVIVSTRGKRPAANRDFYAVTESKTGDAPVIILVNRHSASASEIVAGAVQDWDAGLVLGDTTHGKGSVQTMFPLQEGGIKLTTATYHTPSGRCINRSEDTLRFLLRNPTLGKEYTTLGFLERTFVSEGHIIPDVVLERELSLSLLLLNAAKPPPAFLITAVAKRVFIQYASKYAREHPELKRSFEIGAPMLADFKSFMRSKEVEFTDAAFDSFSTVASDALKEAIGEQEWGTAGKYEALIASDSWIRNAIDILGEVKVTEQLFKVAHVE
jgi:carboxyl-terminal processing protease